MNENRLVLYFWGDLLYHPFSVFNNEEEENFHKNDVSLLLNKKGKREIMSSYFLIEHEL